MKQSGRSTCSNYTNFRVYIFSLLRGTAMIRSQVTGVFCFTLGLLLFGFCETGNAQILFGKLRGILRGPNCCPQRCNPCPTQVCPPCVDPCGQRNQTMLLPTTKQEACEACCRSLHSTEPQYGNCVDACTSLLGTSQYAYCKCYQTPFGWVCNQHFPNIYYCCPPTRRFRLFCR